VGIIVMSGDVDDTALATARRIGATTVLEKPFFPDQMLAAVEYALRSESHAT
jgi:DNA-binding response OmpR family regulator